MTESIRSAASNPASQLSPPTLHWSTVGSEGDRCDLCRAEIKPHGDCFLSVRRAFELSEGRMVESEPIRVLMCVACGWTRPYAPRPQDTVEWEKPPQNAPRTPDGALPEYFDAGVMGDPRD